MVLKLVEQMLSTYSFYSLAYEAMKEMEPLMTDLVKLIGNLKTSAQVCVEKSEKVLCDVV